MKKNLLITGASSDVGVAFIHKYYKFYDKIIAQYFRSSEELLALKSTMGDTLELIQADFSSQESTENFLANLSSNSIIITHFIHLSAPKVCLVKFKDLTWDSYQKNIDVQLKSAFYVTKVIINSMVKNKYGKIVFMISSAVEDPGKYLNSYNALKYALLGFMKSLSVEYTDKNININAVSPSMMRTKFLENIPDIVIASNSKTHPLKRLAEVDDVIPSIQFLLSDEASFITGENILISGGGKNG